MFTKSLSQRIRHIRGSLKLKSLMSPPGQTAAVPRKRLRLNVPSNSSSVDADASVTDVDVTAHLAELKREWAKKNCNTAHIKMLLTHTQNYRQVSYYHPQNGMFWWCLSVCMSVR